jgi:4-carboxymuconolactone decarboxylase
MRVRHTGRGNLDHPSALVERHQLAAQMLREEARATCDIEHPCRGQGPHDADELLDFRRPTGSLALRERPRAEPPVVVLGRTLVEMRAHLIVRLTLRHLGDPMQANVISQRQCRVEDPASSNPAPDGRLHPLRMMVEAVFPETLEVRTRRTIRAVPGSTRLVLTNSSTKGTIMAGSTSETPVLDLLASMTANSIEASSLDPETLMLVRIAALAAVDAPSVSYLMNLEVAGELDIDADQVRGVLAAIAPIVGTARIASATGKIVEALSVAIEIAEIDAESE